MQEVSGSSPLSSTVPCPTARTGVWYAECMAKPHIVYAHLADQVFPSEGGKLNVIGIFAGLNNPGTIGVGQFPTVYPRIALAVGMTTTAAEIPLNITFRTAEGGDVLPAFSGTFQIDRSKAPSAKEAANVNFNVNFDAFQLEKPGKLFLTIESGDEELAELELNVVQAQQPPQASA